jgi:hypothetical protein
LRYRAIDGALRRVAPQKAIQGALAQQRSRELKRSNDRAIKWPKKKRG